MRSWIRIPKIPKADKKSPIVGDRRPSPPLKDNADVAGVVAGGVERKTGNSCMNAELCNGKIAKETIVTRTSWV